jgi:hypothetical protein
MMLIRGQWIFENGLNEHWMENTALEGTLDGKDAKPSVTGMLIGIGFNNAERSDWQAKKP